MNRRTLLLEAAAAALAGCTRTQPPKPKKPVTSLITEELAQKQPTEQEIREAYATKDKEFTKKLGKIDINQKDKVNFYKEVETLANEVKEYNGKVLLGYHYNALPKFFIAFESFAKENLDDFIPKYDPLYSKPRDQRERNHNKTLQLSQLAIDVQKHCETKSKAKLHRNP